MRTQVDKAANSVKCMLFPQFFCKFEVLSKEKVKKITIATCIRINLQSFVFFFNSH